MIGTIQARFDTLFDATIHKLGVSKIWDSVDREVPASRPTLLRADALIAFSVALAGSLMSLWAFGQTNRVPELHTMFNLWLHADAPRVAENMVTTTGDHGRTSVHPLFSILLYPFGTLLTTMGLGPLTAAKSLVVVVMGANAALFSLTIRLLGLPRIVGALFALLFIGTASFMFWSGLVESFPFSCFAVVLSLFMMLRVRKSHWGWWVLLNVLTLGFLITNWVFALIAMAVRLKFKPFIAIATASFSLVVVLAVAQDLTFEKAAIFFNPTTLTRETHYFQPAMEAQGTYDAGWQPLTNIRSMYVTTVVAMPVEVQQQTLMRLATTNQNTGLPEGEISPLLAITAWVLLLGLGIWGATRRRDLHLPLIGAALMLFAQTGLHIIYGEVTFLYSLSFMPLIILFACMAWFTPRRQLALGLVAAVIVFGAVNNQRRFQELVNVADCLSGLESVQDLQTWDVIKNEPEREHVLEPDMRIDTQNLCRVTAST